MNAYEIMYVMRPEQEKGEGARCSTKKAQWNVA